MIYKLFYLFEISSFNFSLVSLNLSRTEQIRVGVDTKRFKRVEIDIKTQVLLERSGVNKMGICLCPQMRRINLAIILHVKNLRRRC